MAGKKDSEMGAEEAEGTPSLWIVLSWRKGREFSESEGLEAGAGGRRGITFRKLPPRGPEGIGNSDS